MKDRIQLLLNELNTSPAEFADVIGIQRSSMSHVLGGRNNPSLSFIQKILTGYPNLSPRWLLLGEGEMLNAESKNETAGKLNSDGTTKADGERILPKVTNNTPVDEKPIQKQPVIESGPFSDQLKSTVQGKKIDRIVFFYDDKSFSSFHPE